MTTKSTEGSATGIDLADEQYQEVLRPVLSRIGMNRYLNGDSITLDPSDYRAIIARATALARATPQHPEAPAMQLALDALAVATTPLPEDRQAVLRAQAALRCALAATPQHSVTEQAQINCSTCRSLEDQLRSALRQRDEARAQPLASTAASEQQPSIDLDQDRLTRIEKNLEEMIARTNPAASEQQAGADEECGGCDGKGFYRDDDENPTFEHECDECNGSGRAALTHRATTATPDLVNRMRCDKSGMLCGATNCCPKVAPGIATTAADQQGDTARASESQAGIIGAPLDSYSPEDQAFFKFWYSHLKDEVMQPPLAETWHSTARYIWDAALAQQGAAQAQAGDTRRLDHMESWLKHGAKRGFKWDQYAFETGKTIREQLDAAMAAPATSGGGNG